MSELDARRPMSVTPPALLVRNPDDGLDRAAGEHVGRRQAVVASRVVAAELQADVRKIRRRTEDETLLLLETVATAPVRQLVKDLSHRHADGDAGRGHGLRRIGDGMRDVQPGPALERQQHALAVARRLEHGNGNVVVVNLAFGHRHAAERGRHVLHGVGRVRVEAADAGVGDEERSVLRMRCRRCKQRQHHKGSTEFLQSRWTHIAMPIPPPMHSVARPFLASRFCISNSSVVSTRAPEAPIGCPRAIAPPLTLSLSGSRPSCLPTATACAANASLASTRSRSFTVQPAFLSAACEAVTGPMPMIAGSTPVVAHDTIFASGLIPRFFASSALISTSAAAPSLMPEALPAVTEPSLLKAGRSLASVSAVVPWRGNSSVSTTTSPLRVFTVTGTISSLKRPRFCAASALFCDEAAKASCSARVIWYFCATFSAVLPM